MYYTPQTVMREEITPYHLSVLYLRVFWVFFYLILVEKLRKLVLFICYFDNKKITKHKLFPPLLFDVNPPP